MRHASVHSKTPRQGQAGPKPRTVRAPYGVANFRPAYGIDYVDGQRTEDAAKLDERHEEVASGAPVTHTENRTGLPDALKAGIESLSGLSLDNVRVHYNSDKPAHVRAYAYAQGEQIYVAPGHTRHIPHEAWHVVQQKQGRVQPTRQMHGEAPVNEDTGLEHEAAVMGKKAMLRQRHEQNREVRPQQEQTAGQKGIEPEEVSSHLNNAIVGDRKKETLDSQPTRRPQEKKEGNKNEEENLQAHTWLRLRGPTQRVIQRVKLYELQPNENQRYQRIASAVAEWKRYGFTPERLRKLLEMTPEFGEFANFMNYLQTQVKYPALGKTAEEIIEAEIAKYVAKNGKNATSSNTPHPLGLGMAPTTSRMVWGREPTVPQPAETPKKPDIPKITIGSVSPTAVGSQDLSWEYAKELLHKDEAPTGVKNVKASEAIAISSETTESSISFQIDENRVQVVLHYHPTEEKNFLHFKEKREAAENVPTTFYHWLLCAAGINRAMLQKKLLQKKL